MDIAGFAKFSADQEPEVVIAMLDAFLADATRAVTAEKGIVISYLSDGFLVTFNSPVALTDPAIAAVRVVTALHTVAKKHHFQIRVGIAGGILVSGIIGNDARQSFTVYGNAVNLAARLESLCKEKGQPLLMDNSTHAQMSLRRQTIYHGEVEVRGLATPVSVFGLA